MDASASLNGHLGLNRLPGTLAAIFQAGWPQHCAQHWGRLCWQSGPQNFQALRLISCKRAGPKIAPNIRGVVACSFATKIRGTNIYSKKCVVVPEYCWVLPGVWCQNAKHIAAQKYIKSGGLLVAIPVQNMHAQAGLGWLEPGQSDTIHPSPAGKGKNWVNTPLHTLPPRRVGQILG